MSRIDTVAIPGTGVIGASWSALFLAAGFRRRVFDPADAGGAKLRAHIDNARDALTRLDMTSSGDRANYSLHATAAEAISLVKNGVCSLEDVDKATWAGPGLRWAAMGPHMLFQLGVGEGGLLEFCNRYRDRFHRWWDDLDDVRLDEELAQSLYDGVCAEADGTDVAPGARQRDDLVVELLRSRKAFESRPD